MTTAQAIRKLIRGYSVKNSKHALGLCCLSGRAVDAGTLFHIDFGFIHGEETLLESRRKEKSPFRLCTIMLAVMVRYDCSGCIVAGDSHDAYRSLPRRLPVHLK